MIAMVSANSSLVMIERPLGVRKASSGPAKLLPGGRPPDGGKRQTMRLSGETTRMRLLSRSAISMYPGIGELGGTGGRPRRRRATSPTEGGVGEVCGPVAPVAEAAVDWSLGGEERPPQPARMQARAAISASGRRRGRKGRERSRRGLAAPKGCAGGRDPAGPLPPRQAGVWGLPGQGGRKAYRGG